MEKSLYFKWLAVLCLVMAVFGTGVLIVGYKAPTAGLVGTIAALAALAALLFRLARRP